MSDKSDIRAMLDGTMRFPMLEPYEAEMVVSALSEVTDYNHSLLNVAEMWKENKGKGVKVVVLDTGCPEHCDIEIKGYKNFSASSTPFDTTAGHSTHVCGIIGARLNGIGVKGIAPEAELYCGKVLDDEGAGTMYDIEKGIRWAVDEVKADVINMSLGCPPYGCTLGVKRACRYARDNGVVLCCAAGNDAGEVNAPANLDSTMAIAAVDRNKKSAYFTCHGSEVDFAAGGVDVYSTWLNNSYAKLSGTSMATPVITGVVALLMGAAKAKGVKYTPGDIYNKLTAMAVDAGSPGKDEYSGFGIPVFADKAGNKAWLNSQSRTWWQRLVANLRWCVSRLTGRV